MVIKQSTVVVIAVGGEVVGFDRAVRRDNQAVAIDITAGARVVVNERVGAGEGYATYCADVGVVQRYTISEGIGEGGADVSRHIVYSDRAQRVDIQAIELIIVEDAAAAECDN